MRGDFKECGSKGGASEIRSEIMAHQSQTSPAACLRGRVVWPREQFKTRLSCTMIPTGFGRSSAIKLCETEAHFFVHHCCFLTTTVPLYYDNIRCASITASTIASRVALHLSIQIVLVCGLIFCRWKEVWGEGGMTRRCC